MHKLQFTFDHVPAVPRSSYKNAIKGAEIKINSEGVPPASLVHPGLSHYKLGGDSKQEPDPLQDLSSIRF